MAEDRILPNLKTRITLDSAEIAKGREEAAGLRSSLAAVGDGAKAGGAKLQSDLISPLRVATDTAQVFAAKKIFDFGKAGFEELKGANIVTAQTTNLLRNLGPAAGASIGDIEDLSSAMLRQSGVDDELAQKAAITALRLGVQGDEMKRVVQDANDLSQSFGDITSDSELLAKALAHPEQAARLLKPAIGGLTTEQQASIKSFVDAGDAASAHAEILDLVEQKVHGAAAAYGQTLPGQVAIAEQSLANLKGELVASLVPALSLATKGEQFLIDQFENLPDGAKAAVGGIGLVAGGTLSLIRPVGDVVRLYQTWKDRSEEVAAAQSALATAEGAEAAASATGAASTASATAVTVASTAVTNEAAAAAARRVVSNEALAFSDAEIAAAEQARQLAEFQSLVSNDALIASDLELEAANTAAAASAAEFAAANGALGVAGVGLTGALALTATGAGVAYGVYSALGDALGKVEKGTADYTKALEEQNGLLTSNVDKVTAAKIEQSGAAKVAHDAGISYGTLLTIVRSGNDDFGKLGRAIKDVNDPIQTGEAAAHRLADELRGAGADSTEFGRALVRAAESGDITAASAFNLIKEMEGLHNGYTIATGAAKDHKEITDAVATSTEEVIPPLVDASQAAEDQAKAFDDATKAVDALNSAETALVDGTVGAFQAALSLTDAQIASRKAIDESTQANKDHSLSQDEKQSKTDAALNSILNEAKANEALLEAQAKATGSTVSSTNAQAALVTELTNVLNTLAPNSPLRMALQMYIDQLNSAIPHDITTHLHLDVADLGKGAAVTIGGVRFAAEGMHEVVHRPTMIVAGESGPERVDIGPPHLYVPNGSMAASGAPMAGGFDMSSFVAELAQHRGMQVNFNAPVGDAGAVVDEFNWAQRLQLAGV